MLTNKALCLSLGLCDANHRPENDNIGTDDKCRIPTSLIWAAVWVHPASFQQRAFAVSAGSALI